MKQDIILSGVGGQGILSIATIIGEAATQAGLTLKQAEVHGMSQRGGDVQSNLRLSDGEIASDLIAVGTADMILSLEPMEALRYIPYLNKDGWVITSSSPFKTFPIIRGRGFDGRIEDIAPCCHGGCGRIGQGTFHAEVRQCDAVGGLRPLPEHPVGGGVA